MEIYNGTYCVYVHTNKTNGKVYIGKTINGSNPNKRWKDGAGYRTQKYFYRAIIKYTWDGFNHEVVASNLTQEEAVNFEKLLIKLYNANNPQYGYNCTNGGEGIEGDHHTEESKRKRANTMAKYLNDPVYIQRMRDSAIKRSVYQFTVDGIFLKCYPSTMEAERKTGIHSATISRCAFNKCPSASGYIFLFEEDLDKIEQRISRYQHSRKLRKEHIVRLTMDGEFIDEWLGAADAGKHLNIEYKNINAVCRNVKKSAGGYKWMYLSDYESLNNTK